MIQIDTVLTLKMGSKPPASFQFFEGTQKIGPLGSPTGWLGIMM